MLIKSKTQNLKGRNYLKNLRVDGRMITKSVEVNRICIRFKLLIVGSSRGFL